jgi:D-arabinose 5-phosphate isomerase GutQ
MRAKRIFVAGAGRSSFAARAFSNRLMHLGFSVWFVGEPTTPSLSWLIYDSVVIALKEKTAQTDAQMFSRHANLE